MPRFTERDLEALINGSILGLLASGITALFSNAMVWEKIKTFLAGVIGSILLMLILSKSEVSELIKYIGCSVMAACVSTLWPLLPSLSTKWVKGFFQKNTPTDKNV